MVEYLFISIVFAVIGLVIVIGFAAYTLPRARARRELARRKSTLASQEDLEKFIRRVDQVTAADELDHLDEEKRDD
jgi:hypothetical protein